MSAQTPATPWATTVETAVPHERRRAVRTALAHIVAGNQHLAYLELCVSVTRQARMSGINLNPTGEPS